MPVNLENHPLASIEQIPVVHISKIKNNKKRNLILAWKNKEISSYKIKQNGTYNKCQPCE